MPTAPIANEQGSISDRRTCILGTAGHIDHGKSSLVKALTGTDPDRLPEEKTRGMTIELGFAQLKLPGPNGPKDGCTVGIVDVPGHERFVRTMVAGATGIDLGMLVVAADDGVMPQTREHLDILDLLGVGHGLIVINKSDLVETDRIAQVRAQVAATVESTALGDWPVIPVSAKTGQGLDDLLACIAGLIDRLPQREAGPIFRLAIDRVFPIHGRGTVITGSVIRGAVAAGMELELHPPGLPCKVREVQSHGRALHGVAAGQRAALNLTGIDREKIERGMELATPGFLTSARYLDAQLRLRSHVEKPLRSHQRVRVSMGTSETMAVVVIFGTDEILPGARAFVQFRFDRPVVASHGQHFIVRNENAESTLGGGGVVRPVSRRIRGNDAEEFEMLTAAAANEPIRRLGAALKRWAFGVQSPASNPRVAARLACETGIDPASLGALFDRLVKDNTIIRLDSGREIHRATLDGISKRALAYLQRHHKNHPNEPGIQRDRLIGWLDQRTAPGCGRLVLAQMEAAGQVQPRGPYIAHHQFKPALSPDDAALLERLVSELVVAGFDPPALAATKAAAGLSRPRLKVLEDAARCDARLVLFAPEQFISVASMEKMKETVRRLGCGRAFKLAEVRDALGLSRRVVQSLLEHLDRVQFTKRVGDERVLLETAT